MNDTKAKIVEALNALPEERQREVLDYVETLRSEEEERTGTKERDPQENPLLDLIGSVDEDLGSDRIDEQLYGDDPA
jgi:hypothetical protein